MSGRYKLFCQEQWQLGEKCWAPHYLWSCALNGDGSWFVDTLSWLCLCDSPHTTISSYLILHHFKPCSGYFVCQFVLWWCLLCYSVFMLCCSVALWIPVSDNRWMFAYVCVLNPRLNHHLVSIIMCKKSYSPTGLSVGSVVCGKLPSVTWLFFAVPWL